MLDIYVVNVQPIGSKRTYTYLAGARSFYKGDLVEVPLGHDDTPTLAIVVDTKFVTYSDLPVEYSKMKTISRLLFGDNPIRMFENAAP